MDIGGLYSRIASITPARPSAQQTPYSSIVQSIMRREKISPIFSLAPESTCIHREVVASGEFAGSSTVSIAIQGGTSPSASASLKKPPAISTTRPKSRTDN